MRGFEAMASGYLVCSAGGERLAFAASDVRGVEFPPPLTPLPLVPPYLRGIYNRRGTLQPVVDLAAYRGRGCGPVGYVVSVARAGRAVGLLVESVDAVRSAAELGTGAAPAEVVDVEGLLARLADEIAAAAREG